MDIHARIQAFLQQQSITALPVNGDAFPDQQYMKAGIIPFVKTSPSPLEGEGRGGGKPQGNISPSSTPLPNPPPQGGRELKYLMMKPVAKLAAANPPGFQICKGTRMYLHRGSGWRDMRAGDEKVEGKEPLPLTALREGIEEVGLKLEAIKALYDVGPYKFSSETTGKNKYMWLFAAELAGVEDILPAAEVASSTAERGWLTLAEFTEVGRGDHRGILADIESRLISIG